MGSEIPRFKGATRWLTTQETGFVRNMPTSEEEEKIITLIPDDGIHINILARKAEMKRKRIRLLLDTMQLYGLVQIYQLDYCKLTTFGKKQKRRSIDS